MPAAVTEDVNAEELAFCVEVDEVVKQTVVGREDLAVRSPPWSDLPIYHFGDSDPSGRDIPRNVKERIDEVASMAEIYSRSPP